MNSARTRLWVGVDLGGTGTRVAIVNDDGVDVAGATVPTATFEKHAIEALSDLIRGLVSADAELAGVGIGASGPIDLTTGLIHNPDTLPQFSGLNVASGLERELSAPTWIDNDAVVAGLAETTWGAAALGASVLCVTLGTGVGAVVIQGGRPVRAADGQHPEGGHIAVAGAGSPCYCGLPQCWEQVASRTALDRLRQVSNDDDPELWLEYASRIASGLVTLLTLYHPACVVIGGSVAQHWSNLEVPLRAQLSRFRVFDPAVLLVASSLGERGGALGASLLPRHRIGWGNRKAPTCSKPST